MKKFTHASCIFALSAFACAAAAETVKVKVFALNEEGLSHSLGMVSITETAYGTVFTPDLTGLTPGLHGFHLHQNPSCEPGNDGKPGGGAGGHFDPDKTDDHGAPWGRGHKGDLPALYVNLDGQAKQAVLAPRLRLKDVKQRALMIHDKGDNYADDPKPLGGGGARVACGVID